MDLGQSLGICVQSVNPQEGKAAKPTGRNTSKRRTQWTTGLVSKAWRDGFHPCSELCLTVKNKSRRQAGDGSIGKPPPVNHSVLGDKRRYLLSHSALQLLCESLTNDASKRYKKVIQTSPCKTRETILGLSRLHFPNSILYPQSHHCLEFIRISYTFFLCM